MRTADCNDVRLAISAHFFAHCGKLFRAKGDFLCAFSHIFGGGYAAGYYSYKWSEVMSADLFAAFEEAGRDDAQAIAREGRRLRDTLFALGGSEDPMIIFERFRGRKPTIHALLQHTGLAL
jgi:oligopeptidase A